MSNMSNTWEAALVQLVRIKHVELLMKIEKEGIVITDKIDAKMPAIISHTAGFYIEDYTLKDLERAIARGKESENV